MEDSRPGSVQRSEASKSGVKDALKSFFKEDSTKSAQVVVDDDLAPLPYWSLYKGIGYVIYPIFSTLQR